MTRANWIGLLALFVMMLGAVLTVETVHAVMKKRGVEAIGAAIGGLFAWAVGVFLVRLAELAALAEAGR